MNRAEARDRFRSVVMRRSVTSRTIALGEAKVRFREASAGLDKKLTLDGLNHGPWGTALYFIAALFGTGRGWSWLLPLMAGLMRVSGNAIDMLLGILARKPKSTRRSTHKA